MVRWRRNIRCAGVRPGARFRFSVMPPGAIPTLVEVRISVR
jgi:hypothetical protein